MWKVLEIFFISPNKENYLMDISRSVGLAHTSVKDNLSKLVKMGLINEAILKKGERKFPVYKADVGSSQFKRHKIIYNLTALFESGLVDFLVKKLAPNTILVFGSYRRGEDSEDSDIDLFVEAVEEKINLSSFEKNLRRRIQLHFKENFTKYPKELKNNIINGIVLHGFLEGYK